MKPPTVYDGTGKLVEIGATVRWDTDAVDPEPGYERAEVVGITDWDGDYSDELQRGISIPPKVVLRYSDGFEQEYPTQGRSPRFMFDEDPGSDAEELIVE